MRAVRVGLLVVLGVVPLCAAADGAKSVVDCGATLTRSAKLDADLVCGASALTIATPGVVLNCSGHTIRGAVPGGTGVQVTAANVAVNDCTIEGFSAGIRARNASGLTVARNRFSNLNSAVRVDTSADVVVVDNRFDSSLGHISMSDCPQAVVERNEFVPLERHVGIINLQRCPNSRISRNRSAQGVAVAVWRASDDSIVANNALGGIGRVSVGFSSRVKVMHNSAGGVGTAHNGNLFGADLTEATDCEIAHNEFAGVGILVFGLSEYTPDGSTIPPGADDNRVHDNEINDAAWGILVFGGSRNLIDRNAFSGCEVGMAAFPLINGETLPVTPSTDNDFLNNVLDGGSYGIYTANAGGNRYEDNHIRGFAIGVNEIQTDRVVSPDVIRNNIIADNRYFGLLAEGASPTIFGNDFERNGGADQPPGLELFPLSELIGSARGGIGLFPFNGTDPSTLDDGDPANDKLSEPLIGLLDEPNVFEENAFADIYALDTRASNASALLTSNQFMSGGTAARVRQDWFGAVRVAMPDGSAASGAAVELTDALGTPVASMTTDADGVAPDGCDPSRPMGRLSGEEGGPTPAWLRITEYIVDRDGNRVDSTPHRISIQSDGRDVDATYEWNGCGLAQCASLRRYQIADVALRP
jgi:parallel beta-helix repeat protein